MEAEERYAHNEREDKCNLSVPSCSASIYLRPAGRPALSPLSLPDRKTLLGHTEPLSAPARCPPPPASAPLTGPRCNPPLFISTSLISHARISEQSAILINVSCFSAPPVQGITQIKKRDSWTSRRRARAPALPWRR